MPPPAAEAAAAAISDKTAVAVASAAALWVAARPRRALAAMKTTFIVDEREFARVARVPLTAIVIACKRLPACSP